MQAAPARVRPCERPKRRAAGAADTQNPEKSPVVGKNATIPPVSAAVPPCGEGLSAARRILAKIASTALYRAWKK